MVFGIGEKRRCRMTDKEALELLEKTIKLYEIMAKDEAGNDFLEAFKRAVEALREKCGLKMN